MKKLIAVLMAALMLMLALPALAEGDAPDELDAAIQYANENSFADTDDETMHSDLRSVWLMDVSASRESMSEKGVEILNEYYGDYERVYMVEYAAYMGKQPMPLQMITAVGVKADGTMEECMTLNYVRSRKFDDTWCDGMAIELVRDYTLAEIMKG